MKRGIVHVASRCDDDGSLVISWQCNVSIFRMVCSIILTLTYHCIHAATIKPYQDLAWYCLSRWRLDMSIHTLLPQWCIPVTLITLLFHYNDVIMSTMASQITSLTIVYSIAYLSADQRKHQSSAILAFVRGIHRRPVNSPHKRSVTRNMFPFDDVIMCRKM